MTMRWIVLLISISFFSFLAQSNVFRFSFDENNWSRLERDIATDFLEDVRKCVTEEKSSPLVIARFFGEFELTSWKIVAMDEEKISNMIKIYDNWCMDKGYLNIFLNPYEETLKLEMVTGSGQIMVIEIMLIDQTV